MDAHHCLTAFLAGESITRVRSSSLPWLQRALWGAAILASMTPSAAFAQNAVVYYDHRPGTDNAAARSSYLLAGDMVQPGVRRKGRPPILEVPEGADACYVVEGANPLLYSYAIAQKAVVVETPTGTADLVTALGGVLAPLAGVKLGASGAPAAGTTADARAAAALRRQQLEDAIRNYGAAVKAIVDAAADLEKLRLESDGAPGLGPVIVRAESQYQSAEGSNATADNIYKQWSGEPEVKDVFALVRTVQQSAWARVDALVREFRAAESVKPEFCVTPTDTRLRVALVATPKYAAATGQKWKRPVDTVATFLVDPVSVKRFEVVPAFSIAFAVQDSRRFSLQNGVVQSTADRRPVVSPGILALGRVGESPVWGALGVSKGRELVDAFLGLVLRGGASKVGTNLIVGGGLTLARVPTELKAGTVGAPLPATAKNLDDIVNREYRAGAAIMFTISGLALGGDDKKKEEKAASGTK